MKLRTMLVMGLAVLSMALVPTVGMADGPDYQPEGPNYHPEQPNHPPQGPKTTPKGHAYGYWCGGVRPQYINDLIATYSGPGLDAPGAEVEADLNAYIDALKARAKAPRDYKAWQQLHAIKAIGNAAREWGKAA